MGPDKERALRIIKFLSGEDCEINSVIRLLNAMDSGEEHFTWGGSLQRIYIMCDDVELWNSDQE